MIRKVILLTDIVASPSGGYLQYYTIQVMMESNLNKLAPYGTSSRLLLTANFEVI